MLEENVLNVFGTVKRVYSDGTAEVLIDGSSSTERLANLGCATPGSRCVVASDGTDLFILSASSCASNSAGAVELTAVPVPVGSYWFTEDTRDPHVLWPGTAWESLSEGRGLINTIDPALLGTLGGSDTLTEAQMPGHAHTSATHTHSTPAHIHKTPNGRWSTSADGAGANPSWGGGTISTAAAITANDGSGTSGSTTPEATGSIGGGQPHQHPYRKIFIWKRLPDTGSVEQLNLTEISEKIDEFEYIVTSLEFADQSPLLAAYPVGAIYMSVNAIDPSMLFGGTWEAFAQGRTIIGMGSNGTMNYCAVNATGGADSVTLTSAQMPSHTHLQDSHTHIQNSHYHAVTASNSSGYGGADGWTSGSGYSGASHAFGTTTSVTPTNINATATNQNTGGGASHENRMPYITTYLWVRTT